MRSKRRKFNYQYDEDPNTILEGEDGQDDDSRWEDLEESRNREATDAEYDRIADIYERKIYGDDLK